VVFLWILVDQKFHFGYNSYTVNKQELKMGFEKVVLDKVAKVIKQDRRAYFCNGTLFVCTEEKDARRVFSMLCKEYNWKVRVSRVSEQEFAYDFTA
jgi:hypothetical protein